MVYDIERIAHLLTIYCEDYCTIKLYLIQSLALVETCRKQHTDSNARIFNSGTTATGRNKHINREDIEIITIVVSYSNARINKTIFYHIRAT